MTENHLIVIDSIVSNARPEELDSSADYTGIEFTNEFISEKTCTESIFNGSSFENCELRNLGMRNTEFTEARFSSSRFYNVDFSNADFVFFLGEKCEFHNCIFNNGEWRDAILKSCKFISCEFNNTTVSLCVFEECLFDDESTNSIAGQSKRHNIFSGCEIGTALPSNALASFISSNYGFNISDFKIDYNGNDPIVRFSISELYVATGSENTFKYFAECLREFSAIKGKNRQVRARYLSKIVEKKSERGDFQVFALQRLILIIRDSLPQIGLSDQAIGVEFISLGLKLKLILNQQISTINAVLDNISYPELIDNSNPIVLKIDTNLSERDIKLLTTNAAMYADICPDEIKFTRYATGSTIIEFLILCTVEATLLITAFAYTLKRIKLLLLAAGEVCDAGWLLVDKLKKGPTSVKSPTKKSSIKKAAPQKSITNNLKQVSNEVLGQSDLDLPDGKKPNADRIEEHVKKYGNAAILDAHGEMSIETYRKAS